MCKFIGKSNEWILCKLSKSEILRLYAIVHIAMETTKTSNFTCQSKSFISVFFTCQVSACELQPFSYHDLPNDIYSQTVKTVFSHLNTTPREEGYFYGLFSVRITGFDCITFRPSKFYSFKAFFPAVSVDIEKTVKSGLFYMLLKPFEHD